MPSSYQKQILASSTPDQQGAILQVLEQVAPLDVDVVGVDTARRIVAGGAFERVEGGRHLDLSDTIGLLSGIATLAQMLLLTGFWVRKKLTEARERQEAEWQALFGDLREQARRDETLGRLLEQRPELLREMAEVLDRHFAAQEAAASDGATTPDR